MLARLNVENLPSLLVLEQVSTVGQTPGLGSGHCSKERKYKYLHDSMERTNATHYWLVKRA